MQLVFLTAWQDPRPDSSVDLKRQEMLLADALRRVAIDEPGYAMPLEFWARAWREGLTVCEMPVERIYFDHDRSFGEHLDDPELRFAYYMSVWDRALREDAPKKGPEGQDG